jgi:sugar lactone lactonase YvrE
MPAAGDGVLYSMDLDRSLKSQVTGVSISNGLAWSPDHRTMYYVDSEPAKRLYAFDYDMDAGTVCEFGFVLVCCLLRCLFCVFH